jgi:hypothetical protein
VTPELDHDTFMIWASDHMVYGPLDAIDLTQWIKDGRVHPKTWMMSKKQNRWCLAESIHALRPLFSSGSTGILTKPAVKPPASVIADELRQFPAFSGISNQQLEQFIHFGELVEAPAGRVIMKRRDPGDSLFFLLSGELRARVIVGQNEKILGRVKAGDCFGEIAMFMSTPRVADVVVESNARMLRVTSEAFLKLINEQPQIAAPILFAMARVLATRVSASNQEHQQAAVSEFLWR